MHKDEGILDKHHPCLLFAILQHTEAYTAPDGK